jgi:hypothetical protein
MSPVFSVSLGQPPDTLWTKTYGGPEHDEGLSVQQTLDGGYVVAGYTNSFGGPGGSHVWLLKTDAAGDTLWTRTYLGTHGGTEDCWAWSVQQTSDTGYVLAGHFNWEDMWLIKTDATGGTSWTRRFDAGNAEEARSVQETSRGGYIVAGFTGVPWTEQCDAYLVLTDESGDTVWTRTYDAMGYEEGWSVQETLDGGYVIAGCTGLYPTAVFDAYLVKTDVNGDTLWTRTYDAGRGEYGRSVQQTSDGGYIVAGYSCDSYPESNPYLVKTDAGGNAIWARTYDHTLGWFFAVQQTADDGYIAAGARRLSDSDMTPYLYLVRIDSLGDTLWTDTYLRDENASYTMSVKQCADGGYIIAGSVWLGGGDDLWLIKTEPETVATDENGIAEPASIVVNAFPNPFRERTDLWVLPPHDATVDLAIHDVAGRRIRECDYRWAGRYMRGTWYGDDDSGDPLASGVYFLTCRAGGHATVRKLLLLR